MAGYSGTPLSKKLGIAPGARVLASGAPRGFRASLDPLPAGVRFARELEQDLDVIVLFHKTRAGLERELARAARSLREDGGLWIAWPKQSSGVATDVDFDVVQKAGLRLGLVDNKVCAIDDTWSGLRFVVRLANRARKR